MWSDRSCTIAAVSVAADVPRRIRELIADNNMGVGDRLPPERELAVTLGVSRPALREGPAAADRSRARLNPARARVPTSPGSTGWSCLEVRDRLEPHAARQAAKNHTAIDAAAFSRILEDLRDGVRGSYNELRLAIASASGNGVLAATVGMLVELSRASSRSPTAWSKT